MKDEDRFCIDKWREQKLLGRFWMRVKADIIYKNKVTKSFRNAEKSVLRCSRSYRLSHRIRTTGLHKRNPSGEGEK